MSVGTANIAGTAVGMNVLTTFRQTNGQSAVLVNSPTLTGAFSLAGTTPVSPSAFSINATNGATIQPIVNGATTTPGGPTTGEAGAGGTLPAACPAAPCLSSTPQLPAGTPVSQFPYISTFGTTGGAFGIGFAPANYSSGGVPFSLTPYTVPVFGATLYTPWGGPPAYDPNGSGKGTRDGTFNSGLLGVAEGISVFRGVTLTGGAVTLSVAVPTVATPFVATATDAAPVVLPTAATPTVAFDGTGQATVSYVLPAGVVGAYVQVQNTGIIDTGSGQVSQCGATSYYTFWVTASGSSTVTNAMAPVGKKKAFCGSADNATAAGDSVSGAPYTGDNVRAWLTGFDYNHYAITYNGSVTSTYPQKPALPATADVTISARGSFQAP